MQQKINTAMTAREWALLLLLATIWGGSFFFIELGVRELPPFTVVAARVGGGALLFYAALRLGGHALPSSPAIWGAFATMGILNNVIPFSLIAWSQTHIASGLASILNATTPLFTVLVAHVLTTDERMTPARVAGLVIGFMGVVAMIGVDALAEATGGVVAQLVVLLASFSYALSAVFARRFGPLGVPPSTAAAGQMISAAAIMIPLALVFDRPWTLAMPSPTALAALFCLAFLATYVGYSIYYRLIATAGSVNLMLVTFLVPVSAIMLGVTFLGERLGANHLLGMAAIGVGLAFIDGRPLRRFRRLLERPPA